MVGKVFISHREIGGGTYGKSVQEKFQSPEIKMNAFLSNDDITPSDDVVKKIITNIVDSDLLICVITSGYVCRPWLEWEHDFCKTRKIRTFYVVFPDARFVLNQIRYLDVNNYQINLDEFNKDELIGKVSVGYFQKEAEIYQEIKNKNSINITCQTNKSSYYRGEEVSISGNVLFSPSERIAENSKVYLHIPNLVLSDPPESVLYFDDLEINSNGEFNKNFIVPNKNVNEQTQTWYLEIIIEEKSKLLDLEIYSDNSSTTTEDDPTNGIDSQDSGNNDVNNGALLIDSINEQIKTISNGVLQSISRKIDDKEIRRTAEIKKITSQLINHDRVVITGDKGSGKSVILCQLYEDLVQAEKFTLFVRCDDFLNIDSISDLDNLLNLDILLTKILEKWPVVPKLYIIFDSLDAISRNAKAMGLFKQFLKLLWGTNKVKTICSVRSYDYEYSSQISTTDWGKSIPLNELYDEELEQTLTQLGNPAIPTNLKKILTNPLRLKLLSLIIQKNQNIDFTKITNEIELYNKHWNEYVDKQDKSFEITNTLFDIANEMVLEQKIIISKTNLQSSAHLDEIASRNIIDLKDSKIQFFHHAYLDYVVSKLILEKFDSMIDYIKKNEYNVFLRPTILFTFSLLYAQNMKKYLENISEICLSELKYYWKISAMKSLSEIWAFGDNDLTSLGEILTKDLALQRHFLAEVSKEKNSFWFDNWSDNFLKKWYEEKNGNGQYLVEYIKSLENFSTLHTKMLPLIKSMIKKDEHPLIKKRAIESTSNIITNDKPAWYLELSKDSEAQVRSGTISCLPALIETEPTISSEIFFNVYTFEEKSDENTEMMSYGTLGLTSTKRQDNQHVKWECGQIFAELFNKNKIFLLKSVISIFEKRNKEYLEISEDPIIEDFSYIWYGNSGFSKLHDENEFVSLIENYTLECDKDEILEFMPILQSTRLALFHKILLNMLLRYPKDFQEQIYTEISLVAAIKTSSLEIPVRTSIKKICMSLNQTQIDVLLKNISTLEFKKKDFTDEQYDRMLNEIKAKYLSEFDSSLLSEEHKTLLSKYTKQLLTPEPPADISVTMEESAPRPPKEKPEKIIEKNIEQEISFNEKIELLDSIVEYLGRKTEELDEGKLNQIKEYLLQNKNSTDPKEDSVDEDATFIMRQQTIRGLIARGLIRLFYHTKEQSLKNSIIELSKDPVNIVRGEVGQELQYLFFTDYDLTLEIALRYSLETDNRVLFYLSNILRYTVNKNADDTVTIIKNILTISGTKNYRYIQNLEYVLLDLALKKQNAKSKALLDEIIKSNEQYATEIRRNIPFVLKEHYLHDLETQDYSLEVFLTLSRDKDHKVREASSFFLLHSIEKSSESNLPQLIEKISPHLDIISKEVEQRPWQPKIIENLVHFLEDFWDYLPEKTLDYLEKISSVEDYSPYQPIFARGTIKMLNGIFQIPSLSKENRNRSLTILDTFAMAGWPEALTLLSVMERPD